MKIKQPAGFTLIELLIAIIVLAIMSTLAYRSLNSVLKSHQILEKQQQNFNQLTQIITQLQKEIRHIVPRPVHDKYNTVLPALKLETGNSVIFSFTRAGIPNPSGLQKNSLQRIDYIFNQHTLKKHIWLAVDTNNNAYKEDIIATDLKQFKLELLGFDGLWYQQWPNSKSEPIDSLPKAIKLTVINQNTNEVMQLLDLPI